MARRKMRADRKLYEKKIILIDENGIERRKSIYAKTQADLEAKVIKAIEDNKRGLYRNTDITVSKYSEKWIDSIEGKCSDNTYNFYLLSVKHIRETIGAIELRRLKRQDVQAGVDLFSDQPRTAQIYRMTINRICESAVDDLIIARNPCRGVLLPTYKAKEKRGLTDTEERAIQTADLDAEERLFISLLYYCGLRRGEALALGRGDIDLNRGILTVNHSVAFPDNKGILKEPKNAILKQYQKLLALDEVELLFDDTAYDAIAEKAMEKDTGARALRAIIEEFMLDIMYEIPKDENIGKVTITRDYIEGKASPLIEIRGDEVQPRLPKINTDQAVLV